MRLGYTIIYVESVPDTLSFYASAFNIKTKFCLPSNEYGELALDGSTTLAFAHDQFVASSLGANTFRKNRASEESSAGAEISFVVDEAEGETVAAGVERAVDAGASLVKKPETKPWGQIVAYVKDCNGFLVEICTPIHSK